MQLASGGAVIPLPTAGPGKSLAGGPRKYDFSCSKGFRWAYYLFTFHVKFSAAWEIQAHEIIAICDILVSWKTFVKL